MHFTQLSLEKQEKVTEGRKVKILPHNIFQILLKKIKIISFWLHFVSYCIYFDITEGVYVITIIERDKHNECFIILLVQEWNIVLIWWPCIPIDKTTTHD